MHIQKNDKVAFVIHPIHTIGGAERYLKHVIEIFPNSEIFTVWHDKNVTKKLFPNTKINSSLLQLLPFKNKIKDELIPLQGWFYEKMRIKNYDLVWIISDGFEKRVRPRDCRAEVLNILTPPRFLWSGNRSIKEADSWTYKLYDKFLKDRLHSRWLKKDIEAVERYDNVVSISGEVRERVAKQYGAYSDVLYPPVETESIKHNKQIGKREDWFLYLGRVESYKGVDLAIKACVEAGYKIKIAGKGRDKVKLEEWVTRSGAEKYVEFLGFVSDKKKKDLLYTARALIFPVKDEDYGIVPIEAMAAGCPVIAYRGGGVKETVVDEKTGVFFDEYSDESLKHGIKRFFEIAFDPQDIKSRAKEFSPDRFENKLKTYLQGIN